MTYEIMSMNELDAVSGGTYGEYKELRDLIKRNTSKELNARGVEKWLKDTFDIEAEISTGFFLNFSDDAGKTNTYKTIIPSEYPNTKPMIEYISHQEVIKRIKKHFS